MTTAIENTTNISENLEMAIQGNGEIVVSQQGAYCAFGPREGEIEIIEAIDEDGDIIVEEIQGENYVCIGRLETPSELRGRGLGRRLLRAAISESQRRFPGMTIRLAALPLDEETDLELLVGFYESEGFSVTNTDGDAVGMEYDN